MSILAKRVFAAAVVTVVVSYGVSTGLSGQATGPVDGGDRMAVLRR